MYQIEVAQLAAQPALVVKGKVAVQDAGEAIGANLGAVGAYLEAEKLAPVGAPFTRTHGFADGVLEFECGFPLAAGARGRGRVIATELPAGKAATTVHVGSQETSEEAYKALHGWMEANGKTPAGAPWEVYTGEDRMQIYFPIR